MNKILSIICLASFLVSGFSAMPVMAEETPEICSETSSQERASWSLSYHNAGVSNITYLHSLFPNAPERQAVNCINSANWVQIYNQTGVDPRVVDSNDGDEILVYAAHHGSGSFYSGSVGSEFVAEI